jgi:nitroreductase
MELNEAILTRRSIFDFKPDVVPDGLLEKVLSAGPWAQNHRLTEPWRFRALGPETHQALAEAFAAVQLEALKPDAGEAERAAVREGAMRKILTRPLVVVVSYTLEGDDLRHREDYAATCCAIQNIQLAAWGEGLGMQWSSNRMTRHPATYALLGMDAEREEIIGFLYFGFPAEVPAPRPRKPLQEVLQRLP